MIIDLRSVTASSVLQDSIFQSPRWVGRFILPVVTFFCVSCGTNDAIERIPGTERVATRSTLVTAGPGYSISISPDEKWLLFWEWILTPSEFRDGIDNTADFSMKLVSMNLATLVRTEHTRDDLPRPRFSYTYGWRDLGTRFEPPGWYDGRFYIEMRPLEDVVIDPLEERLRAASKPDVVYSCSDCPPPSLFRKAVDRISVPGSLHEYTAAWNDGRLSETMYRVAGHGIVEKIAPDGQTTILFQKQHKGRSTAIGRLRVSPDELYLAYSVYSKLRAPIPLPGGREDIYVRHLPTGKEIKIASFSAAGNFIWSSDSERLYFAARRSGFEEMGVYRVYVRRLFD